MERPALAVAIGTASALAAVLALAGVLDTTILVVALCVLAARAAAAAAIRSPLGLARAAAGILPLSALAATASWRAGAPTLDAIRGANAILGAAVLTTPVRAAAAVALAAFAVALAGAVSPGAGLLERGVVALTALLVVTATAGPDVDDARSLVAWTVGTILTLLAMRLLEPLAAHARAQHAANLAAGLAIVLGAWR